MLDYEASFQNLFKSLLSLIPETNKYWFHMRKHGHDLCWVRTHNPTPLRQLNLWLQTVSGLISLYRYYWLKETFPVTKCMFFLNGEYNSQKSVSIHFFVDFLIGICTLNISRFNILGIFLYELNNIKEYFAYKKINTNLLKSFITILMDLCTPWNCFLCDCMYCIYMLYEIVKKKWKRKKINRLIFPLTKVNGRHVSFYNNYFTMTASGWLYTGGKG